MTQELRIDLGVFGRTCFDGLIIPAGTEQLVSILEDQTFVLVLLKGRLKVSREGMGQTSKPARAITGTPTSPVILATPGTYRLFAPQHCICFRAERS